MQVMQAMEAIMHGGCIAAEPGFTGVSSHREFPSRGVGHDTVTAVLTVPLFAPGTL